MSDANTPLAAGPAVTESERTWGMLAHLSALLGVVVPLFGCVIGPLLVWLARRDESKFVEEQAKEALNFNLSVFAAAIVCVVLMLVFIGFILGAALFIAWLVMTLIAAIRASEGMPYRYPLSLRLVK
ncbi:MAG: DUF4870 domain-containing protein [Proteobacteria bacterium]|nr:DUF4870 domain-containing protein [Pseudomonadota bacterium]